MSDASLSRRGFKATGLVFGLVFVWKLVLWFFFALPVPANDSFFYDGAVVNYLQHNQFINPSLVQAFPINGGEFFSPYPPLYQLVLLPWMWMFGTSALSAMALHLALFGVYLFVVWAIFQALLTPAWCANVGALFTLAITFHDRPDTLAHVFGALSVFAWIRSRRCFDESVAAKSAARRAWGAMTFVVLSFATSFQIGTIYLLSVSIGMLATRLLHRDPFPVAPWCAMLAMVAAVGAAVVFGFPGFLEHARLTPSITGPRWPGIWDVLKVLRTVPGLIAVTVLLPIAWFRQRSDFESQIGARNETVVIALLLSAVAVLAACLFVLTPNTIAIAAYLQPLAVGCFLAVAGGLFSGQRWLRGSVAVIACALLTGTTRAVGMTTWGLVCASDVGYGAATKRVREELNSTPPGSTVLVSSAFLYEAARHRELKWVHADWLPQRQDWSRYEYDGLLALKPAKLVLTQFDYYRRYEPVLTVLQKDGGLADLDITNTAKVRPPDAVKSMQKVTPHVSWAPVIVRFGWK